jgi:hypothetical protein
VELLAGTIRSTGMTPDGLVGIYLVGGSSRIPLVATLIAEQLRIVATNLDQPETAVALGAHHVARDAVSPRTDNLPPAVEERTTHLASPPRPAPQPVPQPVPQPMPQPMAAPRPPVPQQPLYRHPVPPPAPKSNRTPLIVGLAVVLVLAIGGALILVLNSDDETPSVANPKSLSLDSDCTDLLSPEEASEVLGVSTERNNVENIEGCNFAAGDRDFRVYIRSSSGSGDQTEFDGYPANEASDPGECVLAVQVTDEPVYLVVQLAAQEGDQCPDARKLMSTALGNIPS